MKLKELPNTVVNCKTLAEAEELMKIYEEAGWKWRGGRWPIYKNNWNRNKSETCYDACDFFRYDSIDYSRGIGEKIISLAEFKKIQGLDQPKTLENLEVGDVVVYGMLGSQRRVNVVLAPGHYVMSSRSDMGDEWAKSDDEIFSAHDLREDNYTLLQPTPPPKKLKVTRAQIAEKFGVDVKNLVIQK